MKSTTYFTEITTSKAWKYLSEGRKLGSTYFLACSPACFVSTKKLTVKVYWKVFSCFWPIKQHCSGWWKRGSEPQPPTSQTFAHPPSPPRKVHPNRLPPHQIFVSPLPLRNKSQFPLPLNNTFQVITQ